MIHCNSQALQTCGFNWTQPHAPPSLSALWNLLTWDEVLVFAGTGILKVLISGPEACLWVTDALGCRGHVLKGPRSGEERKAMGFLDEICELLCSFHFMRYFQGGQHLPSSGFVRIITFSPEKEPSSENMLFNEILTRYCLKQASKYTYKHVNIFPQTYHLFHAFIWLRSSIYIALRTVNYTRCEYIAQTRARITGET